MKSVRIGLFDFAIVPMGSVSAEENYGFYRSAQQEIQIAPNLNPRRWGETLIHEIMHGIVDMQGLGLKDDEERIVRAMSLGLAQCIRDNPKLFAEILKALK